MSDIHKDIQYDAQSDVEDGVKEIYRIFKENCYAYNKDFTDMVVQEVEAQSHNKKLAQICQSVVTIIKSENIR